MRALDPEDRDFLEKVRLALAPQPTAEDSAWRDKLLFEAGKASVRKSSGWVPLATLISGLAAGWMLNVFFPRPEPGLSTRQETAQVEPVGAGAQPWPSLESSSVWTLKIDPKRIGENSIHPGETYAVITEEPMTVRSLDQLFKELQQ